MNLMERIIAEINIKKRATTANWFLLMINSTLLILDPKSELLSLNLVVLLAGFITLKIRNIYSL